MIPGGYKNMDRNDSLYQQYVEILREELRPAMGCTEPVALAYAAAKAREILGELPEKAVVAVSGNILKNVKSVTVPNTGGLRGIAAAAAAGIVAGDASAGLGVLSNIMKEQIPLIREFAEKTPITVEHADNGQVLDIIVTVISDRGQATVRIAGSHTNIVLIQKDGEVLLEKEVEAPAEEKTSDRSCLSVEKIISFADDTDLDDVREILERQIECNMAIAEEGLRNDYGANIGKTILLNRKDDLYFKMRAWAAAGSDARMNGCELPVVINSGSGNQGITSSVPVIVYAKEKGKAHEELLRALLVSNLITIHLKTGIGRLSAYCGVVSAGCGAAAGVAYLDGGRFDVIAHTVVNALATASGIICDGAKASCAAKIASAVDAGLLGLAMYRSGNQFYGGDGIVIKGVENTIKNVGRLARVGMLETDKEIIRMMTEDGPKE